MVHLRDICLKVDILEIIRKGMCLNKYVLFQTSKETVFWIKRCLEIRSPHFVTYLSVPLPSFKNGLYVCVCVRKRDRGKKKENKRERVHQRERERKRETKRERECIGLHIIIMHCGSSPSSASSFWQQESCCIVFRSTSWRHFDREPSLPCRSRDPWRHFCWSVKIGQADLRLVTVSTTQGPPGPVSPCIQGWPILFTVPVVNVQNSLLVEKKNGGKMAEM